MRLLLRTVATLLLVVGVPLAWVATATADAPMQAGWWWKVAAAEAPEAPAAPVPAPAPVPVEVTATKPPTVPEGGLLIANDPSGPAAVAAVQLAADEGATGTLTLNIADGGAGTPLIVACPVVGVWSAEEGGAWEERPEADCDVGKVAGEATEESVTFALDSSLAAPGGGYDVVLMPDPDSGTPFQTPFEAPADDAWAPEGGTEEGSDEVSVEVTSDDVASSGADSTGSFDTGSGSVDSASGGSGGDFSADFAGGGLPAGDATTAPVDPGAGAGGDAPSAPFAPAGEETAAKAVADDDASAERITAIGLLVLLAGAMFWVSSRQGAAAGAPAVAGVGRFARPRAGRPNGLT